MPSAKLTSKGQITLPKVIRTQLGLREGDRVTFLQRADGSVVLEAETVDLRSLRSSVNPHVCEGGRASSVIWPGISSTSFRDFDCLILPRATARTRISVCCYFARRPHGAALRLQGAFTAPYDSGWILAKSATVPKRAPICMSCRTRFSRSAWSSAMTITLSKKVSTKGRSGTTFAIALA